MLEPMTTTEIEFHFTRLPSDAAARAVAHLREVYGVRGISWNRKGLSLRVEFDATRLNAASIAALVRRAGLVVSTPAVVEAEDAPR